MNILQAELELEEEEEEEEENWGEIPLCGPTFLHKSTKYENVENMKEEGRCSFVS